MTALEIRRDVEGYSGMNEDAFARRFYADRSELESLGIRLTVDRPADGAAEQENYSLRSEHFHLPSIAFSDEELASLQFALTLLDGEFAYAEPLRLALQQITWGRPSPLRGARPALGRARRHRVGRRPRALAAPGEGRDGDLPPEDDHLRVLHDRARRDGRAEGRPVPPAVPRRPVLPARLQPRARRDPRLPPLADQGQGRLRDEGRARLPPSRRTSTRASTARVRAGSSATRSTSPRSSISERIAWQVERHFGRFGEIRPGDDGAVVFATSYANARQLISWVLGLGEHARVEAPAELVAETEERIELLRSRHEGELELASREARAHGASRGADAGRGGEARTGKEAAIRPGALRAARHAGLDPDRRRPRRPPAARRGRLRGRADLRRRAARGRQRAERRQLRRRLVRALRRDPRRRRRSRSIPSRTRTTSTAPRGCCPSRPRR